MNAVKYLIELGRMCEAFGSSCVSCDIYKESKTCDCVQWCTENPEKAVSLVEQWSREHPDKTCLDDFMEKYPKGVIAEETWCSLYNQGSVHRDGCRTDFCQDCFGWSESAEKYL